MVSHPSASQHRNQRPHAPRRRWGKYFSPWGRVACSGPYVVLPPWPSDWLSTQPTQTALPPPRPPTSLPRQRPRLQSPGWRGRVRLAGQAGVLWGQWGGGLLFWRIVSTAAELFMLILMSPPADKGTSRESDSVIKRRSK